MDKYQSVFENHKSIITLYIVLKDSHSKTAIAVHSLPHNIMDTKDTNLKLKQKHLFSVCFAAVTYIT